MANNSVDCPNLERNLKNCSCKVICKRKGTCCDCVQHHKELNQIPVCLKEIVDDIVNLRTK